MRFIIILFFLINASCFAATLTVGPGCTYANIQLAVDAANSGDIIRVRDVTFTGADSTVEVLDKSLIINGGYGVNCNSLSGNQTTLDGAGQTVPVMYFDDFNGGMTAFVSHIYIKNGEPIISYGGGVSIHGDISNPLLITLSNVKITNSQSDLGGAIYLEDANLQLVAGSTLYNNTATLNGGVDGSGGGIYCADGSIEMVDTDIGFAFGNTAENKGGGIYLSNCDLILNAENATNTAIIRLNSAESGGGVFADNSRIDLHGSSSSISSNNAEYGGGVYLRDNSILFGDNGKINNNTASIVGGGFYLVSSEGFPVYEPSRFDFDRYNSYPCVSKCSELSNNHAAKGGAGYIGAGSTAAIDSSWIENNTASESSIAFENKGILNIKSSMLLHNYFADGGTARQLVLTSGDTASTTIELCTIAGTQLPLSNSDSLFDVTGGSAITLLLDSNIIWDNNNNNLYSFDNSQVVSSEYNILQFNAGGTNLQSDPLFVNPGSDYHISPSSPAIGFANPNIDPNLVDIDAHDRAIDGALDAGADEYVDIIFMNDFE